MVLEYSNFFLLVLITVVISLAFFVYRKLALFWNIVSVPDERSAHHQPVIQGAGIIFMVVIWVYYVLLQQIELAFLIPVSLICMIGFWDDVQPLPIGLRLSVQIIAIAIFLLWNYPAFNITILTIGLLLLGGVNAFNFMDGINGMLGGYSLATLVSLILINTFFHFAHMEFLFLLLISVLLFTIFNFRKTPLFFAGDAGSLILGFILMVLTINLISTSGAIIWILLLSVFGIDVGMTLLRRVLKRKNILKPHREHLYEILFHRSDMSALQICGFYILIQVLINIFICVAFYALNWPVIWIFSAVFVVLTGLYFILLRKFSS